MAEVKILSLIESDKWNSLIRELPIDQQDIYFTPEYYRLYEELGDGKARCFVFRQGSHLALYPFLINSVNSLGYNLDKEYFDIQGAYGYNGVISSSYDPTFLSTFNHELGQWCYTNNVVAEFTRFHPLLNNYRFSESHMNIQLDRKTVFIDLRNGYSEAVTQFQRTTKKQIRRAIERYQLNIELYENRPDCINIVYPIYKETMDRVKAEKYLYFSEDYFQMLLHFIPSVCFVAYKNKLPVAAIVAFYNQTFIHGHLGGAITASLEMSPYSLLYDQMIRFGIEKSCNYLHVGGGRTNHHDDALLRFKLNFSSQVADFYIGKKIHNKNVYDIVVNCWEAANTGRANKYQHHLLKYRY